MRKELALASLFLATGDTEIRSRGETLPPPIVDVQHEARQEISPLLSAGPVFAAPEGPLPHYSLKELCAEADLELPEEPLKEAIHDRIEWLHSVLSLIDSLTIVKYKDLPENHPIVRFLKIQYDLFDFERSALKSGIRAFQKKPQAPEKSLPTPPMNPLEHKIRLG